MAKAIDKFEFGGTRFYTNTWSHLGANPPNTSNVTWQNEFHGITNDMWKVRLRAKDDVTSGFNARHISVERSDGYICSKGWVGAQVPANVREDGKSGSISHAAFNTFPSGDTGQTRARLIASAKFWDEVQGVRHAIEGGELMGELGRTARAVKSNAASMLGLLTNWRNSWRKLRKNNRRLSKRQLLGHAGDAYLAWKFGYDPLIRDMRDIASELEHDYIDSVPVTGKGFGTGVPQTWTDQGVLVGCLYDMTTIVKTSTKIRYDAAVLVQRYGMAGLVERFGIHPNNFLPTLYNLLPWTWLLDYFTNAGSLVNAMANIGVRYQYRSTTMVVTKEVIHIAGSNPRRDNTPNWTNAPGYPIMQPSVTKWVSKNVSRGAGGPDAWPDLQFRFPTTENDGGRWQWGNIAAVLAAKTFGDTIIASYGPHG